MSKPYRVQVAVKVLGEEELSIGTEVVVEADTRAEAALASTAKAGAAIAFENSLQGDFERWQNREVEKLLLKSPLGSMLGKLSARIFGTTDLEPSTGDTAVPSAEELSKIPVEEVQCKCTNMEHDVGCPHRKQTDPEYQCENCATYIVGNPNACPSCGFTVFRPVNGAAS